MTDICEHQSTAERRRTKSNGVEVISVQCLACGASLREVSKVGRDMAKLEPFDNSFSERSRQEWERQCQEQQQQRIIAEQEQAERTNEWWQRYKFYLESEHWKKVREEVLRRDRICQKCFKEWAEQAHHLSYKTFSKHGFSFAQECVGVCGKCHEEIHSNEDVEGNHDA